MFMNVQTLPLLLPSGEPLSNNPGLARKLRGPSCKLGKHSTRRESKKQMERFMLKSKIHRATLTGTELDYQGSITIDENLLEKADILPGEQVHVLNANNGQRFVTYAIAAPRSSGTVLLNGPAARLGTTGDKVIIISCCQVSDEKAKDLKAKVVFVDDENKPKG